MLVASTDRSRSRRWRTRAPVGAVRHRALLRQVPLTAELHRAADRRSRPMRVTIPGAIFTRCGPGGATLVGCRPAAVAMLTRPERPFSARTRVALVAFAGFAVAMLSGAGILLSARPPSAARP